MGEDRRGFYSLDEVADEFGVDLNPPTRGAVDTCDRCPAPARYRYERGTATLTLCGHHGQEHTTQLRLGGWFTYRIADTVSA